MWTETEANEKWCPFARPAQNIGNDERGDMMIAGPNRSVDGGHRSVSRCLASRCMAWRWAQTPKVLDGEPAAPAKGLCGLAVKS